ncbi:MAG TPA: hypothetical protein VF523_04380, partial [Burkholderiales bacterium]
IAGGRSGRGEKGVVLFWLSTQPRRIAHRYVPAAQQSRGLGSMELRRGLRPARCRFGQRDLSDQQTAAIAFSRPVMVTLNPTHAPRPDSVIRRFEYAHPIFDSASIAAQRELPAIQGKRRAWFCGAWTGYGFHEDGLKSAMAVANALGVQAPWQRAELAA